MTAENLFAAAAAADPTALERLLTHPAAAARRGGPHDWSPLLYLAFSRLGAGPSGESGRRGTEAADRTVQTARLLLEHGADVNDGRLWHGLVPPFTALTGALGSGDPRSLPGQSLALARLLLEHGAAAHDGQGLYHGMFAPDDEQLNLLFEFGLGEPAAGPWYRLLPDALEAPSVMLRHLLWWAVCHGQDERVATLARHEVDLSSPFTELRYGPANGRSPVAEALVAGRPATAALLVDLGAASAALGPVDAFVAAALAGEAAAATSTPRAVIDAARRSRPGLLVWATELGSADAVRGLLQQGFEVDALGRSDAPIEQPWHTPLHVAAGNGARELAELLLTAGASTGILDARFQSTPLGWAEHFGRAELISLLEPLTRRAPDVQGPG